MPEPYKTIIQIDIGGRDIVATSLVLDIGEFNDLVDSLVGVFNTHEESRLDAEKAVIIKHNMHIPMIARGTLTKAVFDKYGVGTDYLCVMVRGAADRIMKMAERNQAELN